MTNSEEGKIIGIRTNFISGLCRIIARRVSKDHYGLFSNLENKGAKSTLS